MGLFQIGMLKIFSQLPAKLFLCLVMKSFVMLVMTNITHAKHVDQSFTELIRSRFAITRVEVGPLCHSAWLTLDCQILRYYVSQDKSNRTLVFHTEFCIAVYFPNFFEVEAKNSITDGPRNIFYKIWRVIQFPDNQVRDIALKALRRDVFFAHPEHVIIAMLGNENKPVRGIVVDKIMFLRVTLTAGHTDVFKETSCEEVKAVRKFKVPCMNKNVTSYHQLVDLCLKDEPPLYVILQMISSKVSDKNLCSSSNPATTRLLDAMLSWSLKQSLLWLVLKEEMALSAK